MPLCRQLTGNVSITCVARAHMQRRLLVVGETLLSGFLSFVLLSEMTLGHCNQIFFLPHRSLRCSPHGGKIGLYVLPKEVLEGSRCLKND